MEFTANRIRCIVSQLRPALGYQFSVTDVAKYGNFAGTAAVPLRHSLSADSHRSISLRVGGILVDPASSHMLVSKIKPCMSKFTPLYGETANGSLNQSRFLR